MSIVGQRARQLLLMVLNRCSKRMAAESCSKSGELLKLIIRCVNFSAVKHTSQRRKDPEGTPYINHPIGVAHILTDEGDVRDIDVIQAALLHDTVEDTDTTLEEIEREFGPKVCSIVKEVTDDKTLPKEERKRLQIEKAAVSSHEAKLVKLADKLYNLRDLARVTPRGWSPERVAEYFRWAARVTQHLRGTSPPLEAHLRDIFARRGITIWED